MLFCKLSIFWRGKLNKFKKKTVVPAFFGSEMCLENLVFITRKRTKIQFIFIQVHSKSELKFSSSSSGQKVN